MSDFGPVHSGPLAGAGIIGHRVRVWLNNTDMEGPAWVEGTAVGYYDHPTIVIRDDTGQQRTVSSNLRRQVGPADVTHSSVVGFWDYSEDGCLTYVGTDGAGVIACADTHTPGDQLKHLQCPPGGPCAHKPKEEPAF